MLTWSLPTQGLIELAGRNPSLGDPSGVLSLLHYTQPIHL